MQKKEIHGTVKVKHFFKEIQGYLSGDINKRIDKQLQGNRLQLSPWDNVVNCF